MVLTEPIHRRDYSSRNVRQDVGDGMRWTKTAVAVLLFIFVCELMLSIRRQTQTFDESAHLYAGYGYWKRGDFGVNPEHPPFVKLVAALPLLPLGLPVQPPPSIWFRAAAEPAALHSFIRTTQTRCCFERERLQARLPSL